MYLKLSLFLLLLLFNCSSTLNVEDILAKRTKANDENKELLNTPIYNGNRLLEEEDEEIENHLAQMTIDEKIGQLFWVPVFSNKGSAEIERAKKLIQTYHIGGITWFRDVNKSSSPTLQLQYTNQLQQASKYPLVVSIDGEWGLNMRLDSTVAFPRQLTLGAIGDNNKIEEFGEEVGYHMKRLGIHVNFAPVVDVNNNPNNPVINDRSFGEDIYNVANKGLAYMRGMHNAGILCSAKHFPGHGDTSTDSHHDLPVIAHDKNRLDSLELYPFKQLIQNRIGLVMVAHLNMPAFDNRPNRPTTLSKAVVTDLLQTQLGYDGLVITDALNMQGVAKYFPSGKAEVEALKAGHDILLYTADVPPAVAAIKNALNSGEITEDRINKSVRKILYAKQWLGILDTAPQPSTSNVVADVTRSEAQLLNQQLHEEAVTLVRNQMQLPFGVLSGKRFATVAIKNGGQSEFQSQLGKFATMQHFSISPSASQSEYNALYAKLANYNSVFVGLFNGSRYARKQFGISSASRTFIQQLQNDNKLSLSVFGNPYSIEYFTNVQTLSVGYDDSVEAQRAMAQALFGAIPFKGSLPVGVSGSPQGTGLLTQGNLRIKYTIPEELGFHASDFYQVDSIALDAIKTGATPGCEVLIAKNGKVVYNKAYGYHTYKKKQPNAIGDIYDLASITKIAASMPAIMQAYEQGFISTNQRLADLEPLLSSSNKNYMQVGEILNHTSGLKSWIPFYKSTLTDNGDLNFLYKRSPASGYVQVANNVYIKETYEVDSMLYRIKEAPNNQRGRYVYSDLGYYFFKHYLETLHQKPFEDLLDEQFYNKVGFPSLTYNPLQKFSVSQVVPTEEDDYFRKQRLQGYVHDMGAAMQGGVGGHAGLFGSTNDLAMYMQLLLNKGSYGGVQYFKPETIEYFTRRFNSNSRKALGFDKPELDPNKIGPTCYYVSADSFGHTGFTGTFVWADPYNDILFVFLANRTYPTMNNRKLISNDVRSKMQEVVWRTLDPTCKPYN